MSASENPDNDAVAADARVGEDPRVERLLWLLEGACAERDTLRARLLEAERDRDVAVARHLEAARERDAALARSAELEAERDRLRAHVAAEVMIGAKDVARAHEAARARIAELEREVGRLSRLNVLAYDENGRLRRLLEGAGDDFSVLRKENTDLRARIAELERERDAASEYAGRLERTIERVRGWADDCTYAGHPVEDACGRDLLKLLDEEARESC